MADWIIRKIEIEKLKGLLFLLALALLLESISRLKLVSPLYLPPASAVFASFFNLTASGVLPRQVLASITRVACGFALAAFLMVPFGILIGTCKRLAAAFEPLIELLRPLPPPVIIPVAILFLGIGDWMRVLVVSFACSFPILTNSIEGARSVHPMLICSGRSLGLSRFKLLRMVILPAATPQIMAGFRISLPIALIVTILAEMIGSQNGIGYWILRMQRTFSIPEMYAGVMMLGMTGHIMNQLLLLMGSRFLAWHQGWKRAGQ